MNRYILFIVLIIGFLLVMFPKAVFGDVLVDEQNSNVSITITKFKLNAQSLELTYKIRNDSDHDIWICDSVNIKSNRLDYEAYVAEDAQTLVIRKRFDLPGGNVVLESNFTGRYVRLHPGQERDEYLSVTLPPVTNLFFNAEIGKAKYTTRVALEIGYYDKDLRSLIFNTVEVAEKLGCDTSALTHEYDEIHTRYFPGLWIARYFNDKLSSYFRDSINSGGDEILMPPMSWGGIHLGEKVLRLTIDGVYIRCRGEPPLSETLPAEVTMTLTGFDVNDTNLELSWKIKNNTDHDVWICDDIIVETDSDLEVYLSEKDRSLIIRRRLDVPTAFWVQTNTGRYVLLRPEQERTESVSLTVPVEPCRVYATELATSLLHARRLVLEIGFYDEDLPKLIRDILEIAEKLNCLEYSEHTTDLFMYYFKGAWIAQLFGGLSGFEENTYKEGNEEINIPYTRQQLSGEQVLRIEVDGVHIPYLGYHGTIPKDRTCFPAETPVWVDGMIMPISRVIAGQAIRRSLCTTPGLRPDRVEKVQEHTGTFECRDIVLESGNHIGVVGAHCFMLDTGEWIAAQDLKSGLSLRTLQGTVRIKSVSVRAEPYTGKVYNLKIKNSDEYVVGRDAVIVRDY